MVNIIDIIITSHIRKLKGKVNFNALKITLSREMLTAPVFTVALFTITKAGN